MNALPPADAPPALCKHCADSGLAWFYHEHEPTGPRKKRRCWTAKEAYALPSPLFLKLRCCRLALCSCPAGKAKAQSNLVQANRHQFTSLDRIRQLAAERRQWDGVEVSEEGGA
jgi:hypothetical protein